MLHPPYYYVRDKRSRVAHTGIIGAYVKITLYAGARLRNRLSGKVTNDLERYVVHARHLDFRNFRGLKIPDF